MPHTPLIAMLVAGLGVAFILGALANRLRLSPLVGYLLAGIIIGPFTPGFVADQELASQLAEIGVILLMFGSGLHFSLADLLSVRKIAVPGALLQISFVTLLGLAVGAAIGWPIGAGLIFGLALSVSSTVVVLRSLQERHKLQSELGRIAVGWLVVQDIAMILALVLLPAFSKVLGGEELPATGEAAAATDALATAALGFLQPNTLMGALGVTLLKLFAFFALMILVGRRVIPWILHYVAHTGSRELFRLAVLAMALGVAFGAAELFGVSFALGAFFAGMILAESQLSQSAAQETLPLRDAFAVLFFVSVGMLVDPSVLLRQPFLVAVTVLIIVAGNIGAVFAIARLFGHPMQAALTLGLTLSQIAEFSFILVGLGIELELLPETGRDLILAGALISILINPLLSYALPRLLPAWVKPREAAAGAPAQEPAPPEVVELPATALAGHAVLVGYGRVGSRVAKTLSRMGQPYLVIEERPAIAEALRAEGIEVIVANAAQPGVKQAANLAQAKFLISAVPNPFESGNLIERARAANPALDIIARAHSDAEVEYLTRLGANRIIMGEEEIAHGISDYLVARAGGDSAEAAETGDAFAAAKLEPETP